MYLSAAAEEEIIHSLASSRAASDWSECDGNVRKELKRV